MLGWTPAVAARLRREGGGSFTNDDAANQFGLARRGNEVSELLPADVHDVLLRVATQCVRRAYHHLKILPFGGWRTELAFIEDPLNGLVHGCQKRLRHHNAIQP